MEKMDPRTLARLEQRDTEKHVNEISDEAQHEISAAINASARQSIRPYNSQGQGTRIYFHFLNENGRESS